MMCEAVGTDLREGQAIRFHLRDAEAATADLKSAVSYTHLTLPTICSV